MTASAAGRTATTDVWVDYSQYYLTDADEDGQARGRLPAGPGGMLAVGPSLVVLYSGTHTGPVRVTVQVHQAARRWSWRPGRTSPRSASPLPTVR
jgi:hypothetical protein